jgi:branched-subunit amino acid transport protein
MSPIAPSYFWLNIFLLAVGTMTIRMSIIAMSSRLVISDRVKQLFTFIPASILPALIAPMVFLHKGHVEWCAGKERSLVLLAAIVFCYFTRSTLGTIAFGLIALYGLTAF